ncbi:MAG TPA: cysteine-rich CWC family protein [Burkholderiales bacterium]|nr:cysteine-rich CWC family protein [Burkholderiales bacterium]
MKTGLPQDKLATAEPAALARCVRCDARFTCGALTPGAPCWCASFPPVEPPVAAGDACLCPGCLSAIVARAGLRTGG